MTAKMPAAEVDVSVELVRTLLGRQRPDLAGLDLSLLANGWDNVSVRIGEDLVARLPRREMAAHLIENEVRWLPTLAPRLPLAIPVPLFVGEPDDSYPWAWALVRWVPGGPVSTGDDIDLVRAATDLAAFLRALHTPAPPDAPENHFRGTPLQDRDDATRERIARLHEVVDAPQAMQVWEAAIAAPEFKGSPVWIHGDLHPANLLTVDGHLSGVIDFGDITSGDPATDLAIGWMLFPPTQRVRFHQSYGGADPSTWRRAKGWALTLGLAMLAYSADNPAMSQIGQTTIRRVLTDG